MSTAKPMLFVKLSQIEYDFDSSFEFEACKVIGIHSHITILDKFYKAWYYIIVLLFNPYALRIKIRLICKKSNFRDHISGKEGKIYEK